MAFSRFIWVSQSSLGFQKILWRLRERCFSYVTCPSCQPIISLQTLTANLRCNPHYYDNALMTLTVNNDNACAKLITRQWLSRRRCRQCCVFDTVQDQQVQCQGNQTDLNQTATQTATSFLIRGVMTNINAQSKLRNRTLRLTPPVWEMLTHPNNCLPWWRRVDAVTSWEGEI